MTKKSADKLERDDVVSILNDIRPEFDFRDVDDFFGSGLLDSFDLTVLIAALETRRENQLPAVDAESMRLYQLLRERHRGQAVAGVERGMCQGCRIALPMSLVQKARSGGGLVQCVSCERILLVT